MTGQVAQVGNPRMTREERAQVLEWLEESHNEFFAAIDRLSDRQWNWKPTPERWSIAEIAEHIILAEALLFGFALKAIGGIPNPCWDEQTNGKTELLIQAMPGREDKATAPERFVPRERLTRTEVKERFARKRIAIVEFTIETQLALKQFTLPHPFPAFGTLNGYQWLIYVPLHTLRHNQQIAEVKAAIGYPAN